MGKKEIDIIKSAINGGVIGASLGALITGKGKDSMLSALVGAAIGASIKALEESREVEIPILYEEDGIVYRRYTDGRIEKVKTIERTKTKIPSTFSLE